MIDTDALRRVLAAALNVDGTTPWPRLLEVARAQTLRLQAVEAAASRSIAGEGPIVAVLTRRWPAEVDVVVELFAGTDDNLALRDQLKRLIDGWVLAADDAVTSGSGPAGEPCD